MTVWGVLDAVRVPVVSQASLAVAVRQAPAVLPPAALPGGAGGRAGGGAGAPRFAAAW